MSSKLDNQNITANEEEEAFHQAMQLAMSTILPMVLKAAIDLDLLEIIAKAGPAGCKLSPIEIASHLPTKNPDASSIIDRILRLLASHSILTCDLATNEDGHVQRLYGLAPVAKYFLHNDDGISLIPTLTTSTDKYLLGAWYHLTEATLEGGAIPLVKAYGMDLFELAAKNDEISGKFNNTMGNQTAIIMKKVLEIYKGFEGINQLVDVGGGLGINLKLIVSKYPQIKGINFDLPHVVKDAPHFLGVDHVGGDMFIEVPQGEVIFMKWILHDWGDDRCLKLLKNCYNALPKFGKVVVVELVVPESPMTDIVTKNTLTLDAGLFIVVPGAKERTKEEYEALAKKAGFSTFRLVCRAYSYWVMEFHKSIIV
ncbi:PREDICTED: caffeic acid 3-O-methyltransferase-like isoform X1 [Theobroma cacao]|uniref:Caffeic acid 3-O-methyltransferase-like isoform X1 n=1 Tax=Theobroma cacao TaxID=3641 RepID=A0AB32WEK7_THECC|nr:PREDICTED: caffeic acid 3-O-methyltransferase-like isoform X1 [Theobroma cacao]